jgi:hypothetical protein
MKYYQLAKWEAILRNTIFVAYIVCSLFYANIVGAPYSVYLSIGVLIALCYLSRAGRIIFYVHMFLDLVFLPADFLMRIDIMSDRRKTRFLFLEISSLAVFLFVLFLHIKHRRDAISEKAKKAKRRK